MKITIAQINTKVGDIPYNTNKIKEIIKDRGKTSDVIVFPELSITGYPPNDLLEDEEFIEQQKSVIYDLRQIINQTNSDLLAIVGFVDYDDTKQVPGGAKKKYNAGAIIGRDIKIYHKRLLPNYDIFFEKRYFSKGKQQVYFNISGELLSALTICEDIWDENYRDKPIQEISDPNTKNIFNISSSPFAIGKQNIRYELIKKHLKGRNMNFFYVNQVGAQDEIVFDGTSLVFNSSGTLVHIGKSFEEDITTIDMTKIVPDKTYELFKLSNDTYKNILNAIKLGISDYMKKSGIKDIVIGISGGIDSALVAYIVSQIVPKDRIHAIYMPSKHSKSLELSQKLCENLGLKLMIGEIDSLIKNFQEYSAQNIGKEIDGIGYENLQARIRGNILMAIANKVNGLVINTSNKTELALGYGTLYGDLIGGISPLGDLNKLQVYELSRYINQKNGKNIIPQEIISRPPSAELSDEQIDPFDYKKICTPVDELLFGTAIKKLSQKFSIDQEELIRLKKLIRANEFKRRQAPPIIKLHQRSLGIGRIYPIV